VAGAITFAIRLPTVVAKAITFAIRLPTVVAGAITFAIRLPTILAGKLHFAVRLPILFLPVRIKSALIRFFLRNPRSLQYSVCKII